MLPGRRLHQSAIHHVADVERQELLQNGGGIGTEQVIGAVATVGRRLDRQNARRRRRRRKRALKSGVDQVHARQFPRLVCRDQRSHDAGRVLGGRLVPDVLSVGGQRPLQILEESGTLLPHRMEVDGVAGGLELLDPTPGLLDQVGIERTRQPAI